MSLYKLNLVEKHHKKLLLEKHCLNYQKDGKIYKKIWKTCGKTNQILNGNYLSNTLFFKLILVLKILLTN
jgi:hypothetical protein